MDTEDVVHIYNGILVRHRKTEFESVLVRWMNLEPVIQSEVKSQKRVSYINAYTWNLEKWY